MLTEICAEIKNYFCKKEDIIVGDFEIVNGNIVPSVHLESGQYFRIVGSIFNDGVHQNGEELQTEPKFHGAIWKMRVPQDVITLAGNIKEWQEKNGAVDSQAMSPYTSESFGGYSYTKGSGANGSGKSGWKDAFSAQLDAYRRIRAL